MGKIIERSELSEVAYAMEIAYRQEPTLGDAVHRVADQFPEYDFQENMLSAMWFAIDAYVDINK